MSAGRRSTPARPVRHRDDPPVRDSADAGSRVPPGCAGDLHRRPRVRRPAAGRRPPGRRDRARMMESGAGRPRITRDRRRLQRNEEAVLERSPRASCSSASRSSTPRPPSPGARRPSCSRTSNRRAAASRHWLRRGGCERAISSSMKRFMPRCVFADPLRSRRGHCAAPDFRRCARLHLHESWRSPHKGEACHRATDRRSRTRSMPGAARTGARHRRSNASKKGDENRHSHGGNQGGQEHGLGFGRIELQGPPRAIGQPRTENKN
jgi:hypothetical protein